MKYIQYICFFVLVILTAVVACSRDEPTPVEKLAGIWLIIDTESPLVFGKLILEPNGNGWFIDESSGDLWFADDNMITLYPNPPVEYTLRDGNYLTIYIVTDVGVVNLTLQRIRKSR